MDLLLKTDEADLKRAAFRAAIPGLEMRERKSGRSYPVKDISSTGLGASDPEKSLRQGERYQVDLLINRKPYIEGVGVKVVRQTQSGTAGVVFDGLDRRQEASLDKLILEVQKRLIALRKKKQQETA